MKVQESEEKNDLTSAKTIHKKMQTLWRNMSLIDEKSQIPEPKGVLHRYTQTIQKVSVTQVYKGLNKRISVSYKNEFCDMIAIHLSCMKMHVN
jgi:hypothetical protein